eukprot:929026-Prorocentrum_minimum.AAC.1
MFTQVVWMPERSNIYLGSPSLVRLDPSTLLASHDHFGAESGDCYIYRSRDNGATWSYLSTATEQYWSQLFTREEPNPIGSQDQSDAGSAGIFSRRTNQKQESRAYSHDGPISAHTSRRTTTTAIYLMGTSSSDPGAEVGGHFEALKQP